MPFRRKSSSAQQQHQPQISAPIIDNDFLPITSVGSSWTKLNRPLSIVSYSQDLSDSRLSEPTSSLSRFMTNQEPQPSFLQLNASSHPSSPTSCSLSSHDSDKRSGHSHKKTTHTADTKSSSSNKSCKSKKHHHHRKPSKRASMSLDEFQPKAVRSKTSTHSFVTSAACNNNNNNNNNNNATNTLSCSSSSTCSSCSSSSYSLGPSLNSISHTTTAEDSTTPRVSNIVSLKQQHSCPHPKRSLKSEVLTPPADAAPLVGARRNADDAKPNHEKQQQHHHHNSNKTCLPDIITDRLSLFIQNELTHLNYSFELLDNHSESKATSTTTAATTTTTTTNATFVNSLVSPASSGDTFESAGYLSLASTRQPEYSSAPSSIQADDQNPRQHQAATTTTSMTISRKPGNHQVQKYCGVVWIGEDSASGIRAPALPCSAVSQMCPAVTAVQEMGSCLDLADDDDDDDEGYLEDYVEYSDLRPRMARVMV